MLFWKFCETFQNRFYICFLFPIYIFQGGEWGIKKKLHKVHQVSLELKKSSNPRLSWAQETQKFFLLLNSLHGILKRQFEMFALQVKTIHYGDNDCCQLRTK